LAQFFLESKLSSKYLEPFFDWLASISGAKITAEKIKIGKNSTINGNLGHIPSLATIRHPTELEQGWANSSPRAKCGPPQGFKWPAEPFRKYVQI